MKDDKLQALREKIRNKDRQIVKLLNERSSLSIAIGKEKSKHSRDVYDSPQEKKVYAYIEEVNDGPLSSRALSDIFREIISSSRALQGQVSIAYLGPEASFSHLAALSHFGRSVELMPVAAIAGVFNEVEKESANLGIVPVENSTEGPVKATLDRLISTPLCIRAEVFLRIRHYLLSKRGLSDDIVRVYSHPQAIAQCRNWLKTNMPRSNVIETASTAEAAMRAGQDSQGAAIGSVMAADIYGLKVVAEGIEDHPLNTTRFVVIGKGGNDPTGCDKTSILFGTPHVPGALYHAINPFAEEQVNLTRIESYPVRDRMWEYLFFVDFIGHIEDDKIKRCMQKLKKETAFIKILGSYPKGE
jgi:chorismate mutase / prephenate dehydratase